MPEEYKKQEKRPALEEKMGVKPQESQKKEETQTKEVKPEKKEIKKVKLFTSAHLTGKDLPISTKYAVAICKFIKNKNPDQAIKLLELVIRKKKAIPMTGESAHKKSLKHGFSQGKYPVKASEQFIKLMKNIIANAKSNNLDVEIIKITTAIANKASRPTKPTRMAFGRKKFKRTHVYLEVKEDHEKKKQKEEKIKKEKTKPQAKPELQGKKPEEKKEVKQDTEKQEVNKQEINKKKI